MKSFDTDLKKYSEKIKLKVSERKELRERVLSYMEYHPLPKQESAGKAVEQGIVSEPFIKVHFTGFQLRMAGGVLVLLLILVPIFAERAVPGEVLYMLKTGVNEKIQAQLANSPYKKIEFETKLMERRIAEARLLASEGKLTEEAKGQFEETVKEHAKVVQEELTELRTQDADSAAIAEITFNTSLEVQSTVLDAAIGEEKQEIGDILTVVNEVRDEAIVNQDENKPTYLGLVARVETQTTRAYELFETVKLTAGEGEIIDIERRLSDINRLITEAEEKNVIDSDESAADLAHVVGIIQKLITFMSDLDIREAVALETLVPVVLSGEERVDIAREEIRVIDGLKGEVVLRLETNEEEGLAEKVNEGIVAVEEFLTTARTALDLPDIDSAEAALTEGRAFINDLDLMTTPALEDVPSEEPIEGEDVPVEEGVVEAEENQNNGEQNQSQEGQQPVDPVEEVVETETPTS